MGICGGASSLAVDSVLGVPGVLGEAEKGIENRGLNLGLLSLTSLASMRMGSFSDTISMVVVEGGGGEEANGLSVRSGMVLVVVKDYN